MNIIDIEKDKILEEFSSIKDKFNPVKYKIITGIINESDEKTLEKFRNIEIDKKFIEYISNIDGNTVADNKEEYNKIISIINDDDVMDIVADNICENNSITKEEYVQGKREETEVDEFDTFFDTEESIDISESDEDDFSDFDLDTEDNIDYSDDNKDSFDDFELDSMDLKYSEEESDIEVTREAKSNKAVNSGNSKVSNKGNNQNNKSNSNKEKFSRDTQNIYNILMKVTEIFK